MGLRTENWIVFFGADTRRIVKINKTIVVIAALLIVVGVYLGFNAYVHARIGAAVAMERVKQIEFEKADLARQITDARVVIVETEAALEKSRQERLAREIEFQAQLAHVQAATPTQLVDQGSQILGVTDISTDGKVVTMSVETWRKAVTMMVDDIEYKTVREPRWLADEANYRSEISDFKALEIKRDKKDALNESIIFGLKDVISHQKTMGFFEKVAWGAGGFVVGSVVSKFVK
jgi:hypothetical protein